MSNARMVDRLCWPFELSPLNKFYRKKCAHFITRIPFEIV